MADNIAFLTGEDATKSAYVERLNALKALGDPIALRYREAEDRPRATAQLREIITGFQDKAQSGDEQYSHIGEKDLNTVIEACANAEAWLGNKLYSQQEKPLDVKPVITSAEIRKKGEEVQNVCIPIMTRPKPRAPKVETPTPEEAKPEAPKADANAAPEAEMADAETKTEDATMDELD